MKNFPTLPRNKEKKPKNQESKKKSFCGSLKFQNFLMLKVLQF